MVQNACSASAWSCLSVLLPRTCPERGQEETGRGCSGGRGSRPCPGVLLRSAKFLRLTYIFRRLGSFLKIPVASRTDISLSFSRLHGKQADEAVGELWMGHLLHWSPIPPWLQLNCHLDLTQSRSTAP